MWSNGTFEEYLYNFSNVDFKQANNNVLHLDFRRSSILAYVRVHPQSKRLQNSKRRLKYIYLYYGPRKTKLQPTAINDDIVYKILFFFINFESLDR